MTHCNYCLADYIPELHTTGPFLASWILLPQLMNIIIVRTFFYTLMSRSRNGNGGYPYSIWCLSHRWYSMCSNSILTQNTWRQIFAWTLRYVYKGLVIYVRIASKNRTLPYAWKCSRYEIFTHFANDVTLTNIYFVNISHRCTSLVRTVLSDRHLLSAQKETVQAFAKIEMRKFCLAGNSRKFRIVNISTHTVVHSP